MSKPKIHVILGTIREGRAGIKVANWLMGALKEQVAADFELIDLIDHPLPMYADAVSPSYRQGVHPIAEVQKWLDKTAEADGYIMITPEYNHSISSVLKNSIDYVGKEWHEKPVGFVSYGAFAGGARAVEHLRQIVGELRMYDVRDQVVIPVIWAAFNEQGELAEAERHGQTAVVMANKVVELATKLKA